MAIINKPQNGGDSCISCVTCQNCFTSQAHVNKEKPTQECVSCVTCQNCFTSQAQCINCYTCQLGIIVK